MTLTVQQVGRATARLQAPAPAERIRVANKILDLRLRLKAATDNPKYGEVLRFTTVLQNYEPEAAQDDRYNGMIVEFVGRFHLGPRNRPYYYGPITLRQPGDLVPRRATARLYLPTLDRMFAGRRPDLWVCWERSGMWAWVGALATPSAHKSIAHALGSSSSTSTPHTRKV